MHASISIDLGKLDNRVLIGLLLYEHDYLGIRQSAIAYLVTIF
jgi:hypothetical protein